MCGGKFKAGSRPSEGQACTYSRGYVRQDVYACALCAVPGERAGFCLGCKTACHGDHLEHVIDMYSKRAFRCDCGNGVNIRNTCHKKNKKMEEKENEKKEKVDGEGGDDSKENKNRNKYNHNFEGRYCRCDGEQDAELGEMFQCILCEDWFHEKCLCLSSTSNTKLEDVACELVCSTCSDSIPFLDAYHLRYGLFRDEDEGDAKMVTEPEVCVRPSLPTSTDKVHLGLDRLWKPGFRRRLCKCPACREQYARFHVPFLIDPDDFVNQYDDEEEESSTEEEETASSSEEVKQLPPATLTAAERRKIRNGVAAFLESAASTPGEFDPQLLKEFVRSVRSEILEGKT